MALEYQEDGQLIPGVHTMDWDSFVKEFGTNPHRLELIMGLQIALTDLKSVGGSKVYIDGSFVTKKVIPGDFDACWEHDGVDLDRLKQEHPLFFDFDNGRANQKAHYKGELMPARVPAKLNPLIYYFDFFQFDKDGNRKGIICLML